MSVKNAEVLSAVESGFTLVNIRDKISLQKFPFLVPIREAMICIFDFLIDMQKNQMVKLDDLDDIERKALSNLINSTDENELLETYKLYRTTKNLCDMTGRGIKFFLEKYYPDKYEVEIYGAHSDLKHFDMHEVVIIKHKESGNRIGVSLGNVFNRDFTLPTFRGKPFQRNDTVIIAQTPEEVIKGVTMVEGGSDWENKTDWQHPENSLMKAHIKKFKQA